MLYYVCTQWPSDRHPSLPRQTIHLTAGPYTTHGEAIAVSQELQIEKDKKWGTDVGQYFVRSESDLCSYRATGSVDIQYRPDRKLTLPNCFELFETKTNRKIKNVTFNPGSQTTYDYA